MSIYVIDDVELLNIFEDINPKGVICLYHVCMYVWSKVVINAPGKKKGEFIQVKGTEVLKMSIKEVTECMTSNGMEWWKRTHGWT